MSNFGHGYGEGYGDGYGDGEGYGYDFVSGFGFGDTDSWIKIGRIDNKNVSVLSHWSYMKIGDKIRSLEDWNIK